MNKKLIYLAACAALIVFTSGCANGPIRNFFRGGPCNACQPPVGQPLGCGTNTAPMCNSGACGTGVAAQPQTSFFTPLMQSPLLAPFARQDSGETYYANPGQENMAAPASQIDPFGLAPDTGPYGTDLGAPASPGFGALEGSGTRN